MTTPDKTIAIREHAAPSDATTSTLGVAIVQRPQRWDEPFDPAMRSADVDRILATAPFSRMDPDNFSSQTPLSGIIRNDSRIGRYRAGDLVTRQGDYGNSAFLVLSGTVRVVLDAGVALPDPVRESRASEKKGIVGAIAQLWNNHREPEVRTAPGYPSGKEVGSRDDDLGNTRIFLQDVPAVIEKSRTVRLGPGELFGETAALGRIPRTATVFAEAETELLEIRWQGLRDIMRRDSLLRTHIDQLYRQRNLQRHLLETPILAHLAHPEAAPGCSCDKCRAMDEVVKATQFETFGDFDWYASYKRIVQDGASPLDREPIIVQEGHYPNGLILVRSGFVRVSKRFGGGHRTVSYLGRGQVYGQDELIHNWRTDSGIPLQHTLRAVGYAAVLLVPTAIIERHVLGTDRNNPLVPPDVLPPPLTDLTTPDIPSVEPRDTRSDDLLEFLVEKRFINGTAAMVIDLQRCVHCDDCVRACAVAHDNNPRFIRHGAVFGHTMITNACMHCADPVCMIGCPTGAIHRERLGGEIVINDTTCIGCGTCAASCPYHNIRMVDVRDAGGNFVLAEATNAPVRRATKCDLCVEQKGGPACQRACPHDALARIDLNQGPGPLLRWLAR